MLQVDGTNGAVVEEMKKETKPKKLKVVSTKIRELTDKELESANGGATPTAHVVAKAY